VPSAVAPTLADHGFGSGGADIVVESEAAEPAGDDGAVLAAINIGVPAAPDRCVECRRASDALGLERLADAGPDAVLKLDDPALKARTRHVITETARVRAATKAIDVGDWTQLGAILTASHASLRDDFEATAAELDLAVEAALEAGALGARASDGAVIALVHQDRVPAVRELVERRFEGVGWQRPEFGSLGPVQRA
jgi:galactokinase